jgi:hypothetical protein
MFMLLFYDDGVLSQVDGEDGNVSDWLRYVGDHSSWLRQCANHRRRSDTCNNKRLNYCKCVCTQYKFVMYSTVSYRSCLQ